MAMTWKCFWIDLWLTIRYGEWVIEREMLYQKNPGMGLAPIKAEGTEVDYDGNWVYSYYVVCYRTGDRILCSDRREAHAVQAYRNDMRGK